MRYEVCDMDSSTTWPYQIADHHCRITCVYNKPQPQRLSSPSVRLSLVNECGEVTNKLNDFMIRAF